MPDVVAYRDFVFCGEELCNELSQRWRSYVPDRLETFPYPNGAKLRTMAVIRGPDLVMLRAAGGRIIQTTDPMLSNRVLSSRLDPNGGHPWAFREPGPSHRRWRERAMAEVRSDPHAEAWRTDVKHYFGSVDHHVLLARLGEWRCDLDAISLVTNVIREWSRGGLAGLPIGPELSAVLGNALLLPVDHALEGEGQSHYRYMDDVVVVGRDLSPARLTEVVDEALSALRLRRNEEKTVFLAEGEAEEALEDTILSYLTHGAEFGKPAEVDELIALLEEEAKESIPNDRRIRFALRGLNRRDSGAAIELLCRSANLLNTDPRETCAYLSRHGLRSQVVRDRLLEAVTADGGDQALALRLHAVRAASRCPWGGTEGRLFVDVATDTRLPPPLRAHAWQAAGRSPAGKQTLLMEAASEERHPVVRRAAVLALRRAPETPTKRAFLRKLAGDPYARFAAVWAGAA